jgi:hypothetical protein
MSIAPLHGRPAPLLFAKQDQTHWPRYSPSELKSAPLTRRAQRERRKRFWRAVLIVMLFAATIAGAVGLARRLSHLV